ncbi:hypothetical protein NE237_007979 [Protea cynaroides]|uniref:Uncharacterized protein n=1 Tax=Protea cynaroides TaxID=273540 RepID=A0A9Q0QWZ5_9MAGN|nr:hypothetical protein NE237_007979 [Protea cynaroides]
MRLIITTFVGVVFGFLVGVSKLDFPSSLLPSTDLTYIEDKNSGVSTQTFLLPAHLKDNGSSSTHGQNLNDTSKGAPYLLIIFCCDIYTTPHIWVPTNPRGAERVPPGIIVAESDFYLRRLWGNPSEDLTIKPKYLVTFTVGYAQKYNIDAAVKKFSEDFTILLFHYDGRTSEWDEFDWSKRAIHVSARKQTKWWYAKRFLHPVIVAPYDYIFIWDEDLGVEHFDAEECLVYILLLLSAFSRKAEEKDWCPDPHLPPCAAFVEIMAPVFSRDAWRCVWHMIQA